MTNPTRVILMFLSVVTFSISVGNLFLGWRLFGGLDAAVSAVGVEFWKNALDGFIAVVVIVGMRLSITMSRLSRSILLTVLPVVAVSQSLNLASFVVGIVRHDTAEFPVTAAAAFSAAYVAVAILAFRTIITEAGRGELGRERRRVSGQGTGR